ncbi:hypothetical protein BKI52_07330 [marine bacterium AO1-C]|nr:hypothetical protein BKI52_07330 [marine bacterium AO1-C]
MEEISLEEKFMQLLRSADEANVALAFEIAKGTPLVDLEGFKKRYLTLWKCFFGDDLQEPEPLHIAALNQPELDLKHKKLTYIPSEIGLLVNLQKLQLFVNKLTRLPKEIAALKKLHWLGLAGNEMKDFEAIASLHNLQWLSFAGNNLSHLPQEIESLQNLRELNLRFNPIYPKEQAQIRRWLPNCEVHFSEFKVSD